MHEMTDKLTRAQREQIIFNHLKGKNDPLFEVIETKHGKYIVKPKQIQLEEESAHEEIEEESSNEELPPPKKQTKHETNKHRTKQDAKRLLDALTSLINSDDSSYESSDEEPSQRAPPLIEPNNYKPTSLSFKRRQLRF